MATLTDNSPPNPMVQITSDCAVNAMDVSRVRHMEVYMGKACHPVSTEYFPNHTALVEHINKVKMYYLTGGKLGG